jgi:aspartyl protease family protein
LWAVLLGILLTLVIGLYALSLYDPSLLRSESGLQRLIYLIAILILVGPALFVGRLSRNFRNLAIWGVAIMVAVAGYTYWQRGQVDIATVKAELAPQTGTVSTPSEAHFVANRNGDFVIEAEVQGTRVVFLVDTGASDVVLSPDDAVRVGFRPERLNYTKRYMTANGPIFGAPIRIEWMTVGGIDVSNVSASVPNSDLSTSLLGMSFLNRLGGFSVRDGMLTLTK